MKYIYYTLAVIALLGLSGWIIWKANEIPYEKEVTVVLSFDIPKDFDVVRKTFVRTKASEELIRLQYADLLEQKYTDFKFQISPWKMDLKGWFKVKSNNPSMKGTLFLEQDIKIDNDKLWVDCQLVTPTEYVKVLKSTMYLKRSDKITQVDLSITIKVKTKIPSFIKDTIDKKVEKDTTDFAERFKNSIIVVVDKHHKNSMVDLNLPLPKSRKGLKNP